jgi:uncharacterized membrane protein
VWLVGLAVGAVLALSLYRLRWLDAASCGLAFGLAFVALTFGGWRWLLPSVAFVVSTRSLAGVRFGSDGPAGPSGFEQTAVNGVLPMMALIGQVANGDPRWFWVHAGAVAVATSDTMASQTGRIVNHLLDRTPVSLRERRRVPDDTSGSISLAGVLGAVLGAVLVGVVAGLAGPPGDAGRLLVVTVVVGLFGAGFDSVLGAWAQCRYACPSCHARTEQAAHCGVRGGAVSGIPGLTNERVNVVAILAGAGLAALLAR